ncbi:MAG: SCO family protein [Candidatus Acidiferrales bacterium]
MSVSKARKHFSKAWIVLAALLIGGCQSSPKHYQLVGTVMSKSVEDAEIVVDHKDIPGFMAAMTMPYAVRDAAGLQNVQPGDKITADVVVQASNHYWLEHIVITDSSGRAAAAAIAPHELQAGDPVPNVPFVNQDGQGLHLTDFKGKAVLLTFIYTRCPNPDFCPRISGQFAAIENELAKSPADYAGTRLLSITLDPRYDTPAVLRKYGLAYLNNNAAAFAHWEFVATSPDDLKPLATVFGLEYSEQDNQIAHSMNTILVGPDGKIAKTWPGNEWKTSDVVAALRQAEVPQ